MDGVKSASEAAIVPLKALAELGRVCKEETGDVELRFASGRNQVFFRCGSSEVSSRLIDGQYPSYDQVIPRQASTVVRAPRADLVRTVRMVGVVSEAIGARPVSLLIDAGGIRLLSQAPEIGEAEAEVEADVEGEAVRIAFNSHFLLEALSAYDVERVEIRLTGPLAPAVIRGVGAESCTCVVMAVRMAAPQGHAYAERELVRFGARHRRPGEDGAAWLGEALPAAGARSIQHGGNHRYAFRLGVRGRLVAVGLAAEAYPKSLAA